MLNTLNRVLSFVILFALLGASTASPTPNSAKWFREVLIGANEEYYYSYLLERDYPGSYYTYTDILHLCKFSLSDGSVVEDTILSRTVHLDATTMGDWTRQDEIEHALSLGDYIADENARLVFPSRSHWYDDVTISRKGLFLGDGDGGFELVGREVLRELMPPFPRRARVVEQYVVKGYFLFLVAAGDDCCMDTDFSSRIVSVASAPVREEVRQMRSTE